MKPLSQFLPNFEYHHAVQGFIYSMLDNQSSSFCDLHDKKTSKFFSFSNIFAGSKPHELLFNLIISSPLERFIEEISNHLIKIVEEQKTIQIGDSQFYLQKIISFSNKNLAFPLKIITSTPILIRIPRRKIVTTSQLDTNSNQYNDVYWRSGYPINLFIDALESNLDKKYREYILLGIKKSNNDTLFKEYKFKKQVSTKIHLHNNNVTVIGSLWEFTFSEYIDESVQTFALDCGLGERNSLGFGFMNMLDT